MDTGTIIIGIVSIALCVLPLVVMHRIKRKGENQRLAALENLAAQHNCKISQHEFCGELVLGIDETNNFVFFLKKTADKEIAQHINLSGIHACNIINTGSNLNSKEGEYKVIDKLELRFTPVAKNEPDLLLEIYNARESMQLVGELQLIKKWEKIINDRLATLKKA